MNKDLTLLIMAAGMGSRFGGLKQIEPVGPNQEFLIDYSIYDAIKSGFSKVVFIIKKENYEIFTSTVGSRFKDKINIEYAFQDINDLPSGFTCPEGREKPWGTAHAILSAKDKINGPFAIINADDFYGTDAYYQVSSFLKNNTENNYCIIGYKVENTLTSNGAVKRGVCKQSGEYLTEIIESNVEEKNGEIIASPLDNRDSFKIEKDTLVSMNMIGFTPSIFTHIENNFSEFLNNNKNNILTCEYLIPDLLEKLTKENLVKTKVIETTSRWEGITYKEDKDIVVNRINERIENGEYPNNLWN